VRLETVKFMGNLCYPKNPYIKNSRMAELYLSALRAKRRIPAKLLGLLLGCDILCPVPKRLFMPHPFGIVADSDCVLGEDVVLLQQVTLGVRYPYGCERHEMRDPILEEGVFVGAGARILGPITIGRWSVIGANAVVTKNVPAFSIVVGHNKSLDMKSDELERRILTGEV
jgi:serine O-acetyltransferase